MRAESGFMDHETKHMLYEPGERIDEYWNIYFVREGIRIGARMLSCAH